MKTEQNQPEKPIQKTWMSRPLFVGEGAVIEGDVRFGDDVSVWHGAIIRTEDESVTIDSGTNIQDGCIIHTDEGFPVRIGKNVTIGHRAVVHGATIEDGAMIGMGAIVMNGAHIGQNAIVGAGALVSEGKVIGDDSLALGMPARIIRKVTEQETENVLNGADHYIQLARKRA